VISPAETWDTHWWRIYNDARAGSDADTASEIADDETGEQFGVRPEEQG
jgi:hypothetical protein